MIVSIIKKSNMSRLLDDYNDDFEVYINSGCTETLLLVMILVNIANLSFK